MHSAPSTSSASHASSSPTSSNGRSWHVWLFRLVALAVAIAGVAAVILVSVKVPAPTLYKTIFVVGYLLVTSLIVFWLLRVEKSKAVVSKAIALAVAIVMLIASFTVIHYSSSTNNLLRAINNPDAQQSEWLILSSRPEVTTDNAQSIGALADDLAHTSLEQASATSTKARLVSQDDLPGMMQSLQDSNIDLATMKTSFFEALAASAPQLEQDLIILDTFSLEDPKRSTADSPDVNVQEPFTIYISGADSAGPIEESGRSDVNILAVVNPKTGEILLVNTPRDYYVQVHGTSGPKDKLTHASIYGVDTARKTMEDLYALDIPYYARVNFNTLIETIDIVGPIEVYLDNPVGNYPAGLNTFDSEQALDFSRTRYGLEGGDRQRGNNQLLVLQAVAEKLMSNRDPRAVSRIAEQISGSVETNMDDNSIKTLIEDHAQSSNSWYFERTSVDGFDATEITYSMPGTPLYVMIPDEESVSNAHDRILRVMSRS